MIVAVPGCRAKMGEGEGDWVAGEAISTFEPLTLH